MARFGALDLQECAGDDLKVKFGIRSRDDEDKAKRDGVFSYIVFKSRAHRDQVNAQVMKTHASEDEGPEKHAPSTQTHGVCGFKV